MTTFTIGKPLPQRARNVFVLHLIGMSGDADAYRTSTQDFQNTHGGTEELAECLRIILAVSRLSGNDGRDEKKIAEAIRSCMAASTTPKMSGDQAVEWYNDMVGSDVTYEERIARLDRVWVTYVSAEGTEHEVTISLDTGEGVPQAISEITRK